jgi:hypothetical protein
VGTLAKDAGAGETGRLNSDKVYSGGVRLKRGKVRSLAVVYLPNAYPRLTLFFIYTFHVIDYLKMSRSPSPESSSTGIRPSSETWHLNSRIHHDKHDCVAQVISHVPN